MNRSLATALSAMWLSRALTLGLGLLLMPVLMHRLPRESLGTWLLLCQAGGIVAFLDFGVTSVLTRRIAIAGVRHEGEVPWARESRLAELIASAKLLYRVIAAFAFVISLAGGWVMLARIGLDAALLAEARRTWVVLCFGYVVLLAGGLWSATVWALGYMTAASVLTTACSLVTLGLQVLAVLLGGGMQSLALVALAGALAQRLASLRTLRRYEPSLLARPGAPRLAIVTDLFAPSLQYWLTEVGAVLLLRTNQFFIAGLHETASIPAYYAAYSLVYNMAMVAMVVGDVSFTRISALWRQSAHEAARVLVLRNARLSLTLMACGAAAMAVIGDAVTRAWLGPGQFAGWPVMLVFCAMLTGFVQQSFMFGAARATEHEAFAACYLVAGGLNLLLAFVLAPLFGLPGIAAATLLAQLLTTNWYVPASALRRLGITGRRYARTVLFPAALVAAGAGLAAWAATLAIPSEAAVQRMLAGGAAATVAMLVGLWIVADAEDRALVRHTLRQLRPGRPVIAKRGRGLTADPTNEQGPKLAGPT